MAKEWFTAQELAGMPNVPATESGVIRKAKNSQWKWRKRTGRGGGREYHLSSLPPETQAALLKQSHPSPATAKTPAGEPRNAATPASDASIPKRQAPTYDRDALWAHFEAKSDKQKEKARRALALLDQVMALTDHGHDLRSAMQLVGQAHAMNWRTIQNWYYGANNKPGVKEFERCDWLAALVPGNVGGTHAAEIDTDAWETFKADYLRLEKPTASACYQRLKRAANEHEWSLPSLRTMERRIKQIPRSVRVLLRDGEAALQRLYPAQQRSVRDLHALEWINGDGYQHNVFVRWPNDEVARPKTWFWQDIYSRKILAFRTDETEHTDLLRISFGDLVEEYGIPDHVTIDNTRAAANKWLTGRVPNRYRFKVKEDDPLGLFPSLGMVVHWTSVLNGKGHGQAKPVERAFGVGGIGEVVDKHPAFAGAYTGHNPNAKPENYGSKAIPIDKFLEILVSEVAAFNARTERRTEICDGALSFDQAFAASFQYAPIRRATEEQRRLWLLSAEAITVKHDGTFSLDAGKAVGRGSNRYMAAELLEHHRQKIVVRFDPQALHGRVYCYTLDGRYICPADCIDDTGFGDTEIGRVFTRARKQYMRATKAQAKAEVAMSAADVADRIPAAAQAESPEARVVRPLRADPAAGRPAPQSTVSERDQADIAAFQEAFEAEQQQTAAIFDMNDPRSRYAYWVRIGERIEAGGVVSMEERERYHRYIKTDEYRQMKDFFEDENFKDFELG